MGETETSEKTGQGQTGRKCWPFAITGERERERERDTFYFYAQRPKRFMQKPLHERSYEDMSQTMGIDMVNFLKQYRDLNGEGERCCCCCCCCSQPFQIVYSNLV